MQAADGVRARRALALGVLALVAVVSMLVLATGGSSYELTMRFESAAQLVKGGSVQVAGRRIGSIEKIELAADRVAEVTVTIDDDRLIPLPTGTEAVLRSGSLSGVANRYVDLQLPGGPVRSTLPSGSVIGLDRTITNIDLDQLFNTFDRPTRLGLKRVVQGFGETYAGREQETAAGWRYLNPALVASHRLFGRVAADRPKLERFVVANARLSHDLAKHRDTLAVLVDRLATTTVAIGGRRSDLARAIGLMPGFMASTTRTLRAVRKTVDDLDPLVRESDPLVRKLPGLLRELRAMALRSRRPASDLAAAISRSGARNDLVDVSRATAPLHAVSVGPLDVRGKQREGAFGATTKALHEQTPHVAFLRPYTPDLTAWFDDFSHSNVYDANGHVGRIALAVPAFALLNGALSPVPSDLRDEVFGAVAAVNQRKRCPGGGDSKAADGSRPWKPTPDHPCDPGQHLPG